MFWILHLDKDQQFQTSTITKVNMQTANLPAGFIIVFCSMFLCSANTTGDNSSISNRKYNKTFINISDCFVEQIVGTSRIWCAVLASTLNVFAYAYAGSISACHICLPPYIAGALSRSSLPGGLPIWMRGEDLSYNLLKLSPCYTIWSC